MKKQSNVKGAFFSLLVLLFTAAGVVWIMPDSPLADVLQNALKSLPEAVVGYLPLVPFVLAAIFGIAGSLSGGTKAAKSEKTAEKTEVKVDEGKEEEDSAGVLVPLPESYKAPEEQVDLTPINFDKYNSTKVEEIDGQHYTEVESYSERIRVLNKLGATDLDIIQTNMLGNTEFSEILKTPRAQKTMTSQEICEYVMTKKGVVTIKKRGAINWTFKYGMKSFLMIREGKDGSYKVSIKCFPDMAVRLNEVFKALEDSNFPAGPIWFSFSELRNLPPKVIEYLIDTAYQIGVMQQKKTDMLKDSKPLSAYDIDGNAIKNKYLAGESVMEFPKFTLVFQRGPKADMNTLLINPPKDLDTSKFIKEFYFKFAFNSELSLTMLPQKGFSDEAATVFFDNIEQVLLKASKSAQ